MGVDMSGGGNNVGVTERAHTDAHAARQARQSQCAADGHRAHASVGLLQPQPLQPPP